MSTVFFLFLLTYISSTVHFTHEEGNSEGVWTLFAGTDRSSSTVYLHHVCVCPSPLSSLSSL